MVRCGTLFSNNLIMRNNNVSARRAEGNFIVTACFIRNVSCWRTGLLAQSALRPAKNKKNPRRVLFSHFLSPTGILLIHTVFFPVLTKNHIPTLHLPHHLHR